MEQFHLQWLTLPRRHLGAGTAEANSVSSRDHRSGAISSSSSDTVRLSHARAKMMSQQSEPIQERTVAWIRPFGPDSTALSILPLFGIHSALSQCSVLFGNVATAFQCKQQVTERLLHWRLDAPNSHGIVRPARQQADGEATSHGYLNGAATTVTNARGPNGQQMENGKL